MSVSFLNSCSLGVNGGANPTITTSPSGAGGTIAWLNVVLRTNAGVNKMFYGGSPATFIGSTTGGGGMRLSSWYFPDPPQSPCTMQACLSTTALDLVFSVNYYKGVVTSSPIFGFNTSGNAGVGTVRNVSVSGVKVGTFLADCMGTRSYAASVGASVVGTASAPQVERFESESGGATECRSGTSDDAAPIDATMGWTLVEAAETGQIAVALRAQASGKEVIWFMFRRAQESAQRRLLSWKTWWQWRQWARRDYGMAR